MVQLGMGIWMSSNGWQDWTSVFINRAGAKRAALLGQIKVGMPDTFFAGNYSQALVDEAAAHGDLETLTRMANSGVPFFPSQWRRPRSDERKFQCA